MYLAHCEYRFGHFSIFSSRSRTEAPSTVPPVAIRLPPQRERHTRCRCPDHCPISCWLIQRKEITKPSFPSQPTMDVDDETKPDNNKGSSTTTTKTLVVPTYEERCEAVNVISQPLASKKTTKKVHKLVKKAASVKHIRRGVKEVVKGIRKGEKGIAILAGDIYPIDVVSHIPILLEENNIPYLFVPSKFDLGAAASTKRPTSCVLIRTPSTIKDKTKASSFDGQELYDTIVKEAMEFDPTTITL